MKAVVYERYGSANELKLTEVKIPTPKAEEVLVKIHAASVNSWDWDMLSGEQFIVRMLSGFFRPRLKILGCDIAGEVVEAGEKVNNLKPGDFVFGDLSAGKWGGFAEYVCAKEDQLSLKPEEMSFIDAAALPQAGVLAYQSLYDLKPIHPGDKILFNGAGGGVGTLGIQMARELGAKVTAVDREDKLDMLKSLGADHVLDYTKEDFVDLGYTFDLVIDVVVNRSMEKCKRSLKPGGIYGIVGGEIPRIFGMVIREMLKSKKRPKKIQIVAHEPNKGLDFMKELYLGGKLKPVIDQVLPLEKVPEAMVRMGQGDVMGKLVIEM